MAAADVRKKIPWWAAGALLLLPIWAISYVGTLERPPQEATGILAEGQHIYETRCASCHGANGGGGSGYKLADGEVLITFPTLEPMIEWLAKGSAGIGLGNPYGDPARGRIVAGGMPGWADILTTEELIGVVLHERAAFGGSEEALLQAEAIEYAVEMGELDLQGHLDPSTLTVAEIQAILAAVGEDGSDS
jgi:mono/diheme cytochrome c family protein